MLELHISPKAYYYVCLCGSLHRELLCGTRYAGRTHNYAVERLSAHEARELRREPYLSILYLPLIFFGFSVVLGKTVEIATNILILSFIVSQAQFTSRQISHFWQFLHLVSLPLLTASSSTQPSLISTTKLRKYTSLNMLMVLGGQQTW